MSTEELLAVLEAGATEAAPARATEAGGPGPTAPPEAPEPPGPITPPPSPEAGPPPRSDPAWRPSPLQAPRPSLATRLHCARHGHDPRPHRPRPGDDIVYRCLHCGMPTPPPRRYCGARTSPIRRGDGRVIDVALIPTMLRECPSSPSACSVRADCGRCAERRCRCGTGRRGCFRPGVWTQGGRTAARSTGSASTPGAPATMYAPTRGGIFKSTNAGATWACSSSGLTDGNVTSIAVNPDKSLRGLRDHEYGASAQHRRRRDVGDGAGVGERLHAVQRHGPRLRSHVEALLSRATGALWSAPTTARPGHP